MADKATGSISTSVMSDFAKMSMSGNLNYTPADTGDKWIYLETIVDGTSAALVQAGVQYQERYVRTDGTETLTATGDIVRWMCIKHTGTTDGSTATSSGIVVSLDGTSASAFGEKEGIFLDSGDSICFKTPACTLNTIGVISVTVTNGAPVTADSPGDVLVQIAAILDDVA